MRSIHLDHGLMSGADDRMDHDPLQVGLGDLIEDLRHDEVRPTFIQTNLVSDGFFPAAHTDPNLVNPWGISLSPTTSPFWVSDNVTGVTTIYDGTGAKVTVTGGHTVVDIAGAPGASGPSHPTGTVFNIAAPGFKVSQNNASAASAFLFASTNGTISGWSPAVNAGSTVVAVDNSGSGAAYTGLTMLNGASGARLYAADFHNAKVDVFDSSFAQLGSFTDTTLPHGYAPFNVQALNGNLFVTFALQDAAGKFDVPGEHHGFVDEFDAQGHLMQRIAVRRPAELALGDDNCACQFWQAGGRPAGRQFR